MHRQLHTDLACACSVLEPSGYKAEISGNAVVIIAHQLGGKEVRSGSRQSLSTVKEGITSEKHRSCSPERAFCFWQPSL
jgi:hypothetical protein